MKYHAPVFRIAGVSLALLLAPFEAASKSPTWVASEIGTASHGDYYYYGTPYYASPTDAPSASPTEAPSNTPTETPSEAPSNTPSEVPQSAAVTAVFSIPVDYDTLMAKPAAVTAFKTAFAEDMAAALDVMPVSRVTVLSLTSGSVKVKFSVHPDSSGNAFDNSKVKAIAGKDVAFTKLAASTDVNDVVTVPATVEAPTEAAMGITNTPTNVPSGGLCEDHTECVPGLKCKGGYKLAKKCRQKKKDCKRWGHHSIKRWGCAEGKSCGGGETTAKWDFCV